MAWITPNITECRSPEQIRKAKKNDGEVRAPSGLSLADMPLIVEALEFYAEYLKDTEQRKVRKLKELANYINRSN